MKKNKSSKERRQGSNPQVFSFWDNTSGRDKKIILGTVIGLILLGILLIIITNNQDDPSQIISEGEEYSLEEDESSGSEDERPAVIGPDENTDTDEDMENQGGESSSPNQGEEADDGAEESRQESSNEPVEIAVKETQPIEKVEILVQEGSLQEAEESTVLPIANQEQAPEESLGGPVNSEAGEEGGEETGQGEGQEEASLESSENPENLENSIRESSGEVPEDVSDDLANQEASPEESSQTSGQEENPEMIASLENGQEVPATRSPLVQKMAEIPPYQQQSLGSNPVYYYAHPMLDLNLDLRNDLSMARDLYVLPTTTGFYILQRQSLQLGDYTMSSLVDLIEQGGVEGGLAVQIVSKDKLENIQEERPEIVIMPYDENNSIAIIPQESDKVDYETVYNNFGDQLIDAEYVAGHITTTLLAEDQQVVEDTTDYRAQWKNMVDQFRVNPAQAEWDYNLPLYANSSSYLVGDEDQRTKTIEENPNYMFLMDDLTGDGYYEYVVHAQTNPNQENGVQGYWAIYTKADNGLILVAKSKYGNGPLIINEDIFTTTSYVKDNNRTRISFEFFQLAEPETYVYNIDFLQPQDFLESMTGNELAEKYPGFGIVSKDGQYYLVNLQAYHNIISEYYNAVTGGRIISGISAEEMRSEIARIEAEESAQEASSEEASSQEESSQEGNNPEVPSEEIPPLHAGNQEAMEDPIVFLQETYPDLPFEETLWDTAIPVENFEGMNEVLTEDDL